MSREEIVIEVLIPLNPEFQKYDAQVKELYEKNQQKICDPNSYEFVRDNTLFYIFLKDRVFLGAIYYFMDNDKLFLNGFSSPKNHSTNLYCLLISMSWFKKPIFAEAQNRASALCLLRCGFKRINGNLFVFK